ncbi:DUF3099 domain-containing protein [Microbacterium stercoris]|uniref:DUF3099 domain-containing protein n=1 Tax=Microbacterium stercoris TaxID=2820289 RepID=A0A939QKA1_9MICO|nr:DUF3099 domain-containing protein [Microbacterium stercoris]MBO3662452.1 DUF3099 domain-containing protein [Microbacterium stercoris]MBO3664444.1 DUF3099 domain-containing protein [Microbacterium stercoris]
MRSPRKDHSAAQSATSLPVSPSDDASDRVRNYLLTMGIRVACVILAALVQPFGWWTWVFAVGAVFLPYIAVVGANAASARSATTAQAPEIAIEQAAEKPAEAPQTPPTVIRISESPAKKQDREPEA